MRWSRRTWSIAKQIETACWLSGCASDGADGSPVCLRLETFDVFRAGHRQQSPSSLASMMYFAETTILSPLSRWRNITERTRSPSVSAAMGRYGSSKRQHAAPR